MASDFPGSVPPCHSCLEFSSFALFRSDSKVLYIFDFFFFLGVEKKVECCEIRKVIKVRDTRSG